MTYAMNHHGRASPAAGKRGSANVPIESTTVIAATNRCRPLGGRREDGREVIEEVREEDEQLDRDALRDVLEQTVRVGGHEAPDRDDQSEGQERNGEPARRVIPAPAPLQKGHEGKGHIDDRVDDAEDSDDGVQRCPPVDWSAEGHHQRSTGGVLTLYRRRQSRHQRSLRLITRLLGGAWTMRSMTTRVLVVDDDPAVRSAVSRALRVDYEVDEAADGGEALARQASTPADVIVLDS